MSGFEPWAYTRESDGMSCGKAGKRGAGMSSATERQQQICPGGSPRGARGGTRSKRGGPLRRRAVCAETQAWFPSNPPAEEGLRKRFEEVVSSDSLRSGRALQIVRPLGRGRQGLVLLVVQSGPFHTHTRYALKVHDPGLFPGAESYTDELRRIAQQASALQRVHHPNLAQCHEMLLFGGGMEIV